MRVTASLPTFTEGPGDELKDRLSKFHKSKLASLGAATHGCRREAGFAVSTQKEQHPLRVPLERGACLDEPREIRTSEIKVQEQHSCLCSKSSFCIQRACRANLPSFSPPLAAVHSSAHHRRTFGCQGWNSTAKAPGTPRELRMRVKLSRAEREELELFQALLTVFPTWQQ